MVIRNTKQRIIRLLVNTWNNKVNSNQVIKKVIENYQIILKDNTFQSSFFSKKYKKVIKGFQNNIFKPSYNSKRLKKINKGF